MPLSVVAGGADAGGMASASVAGSTGRRGAGRGVGTVSSGVSDANSF